MNKVVGCETIILSTSHSPSQPLRHGPSRIVHPRIRGPAAPGLGGARGFAPGAPPLRTRGPLPPAHGAPVARPAPPLRTREQPLSPLSAQAQGRSRGGFGTKQHVLVDAQDGLLEGICPDYVLADWSYDDDDLRLYIVAQGTEPVIPGTAQPAAANRLRPGAVPGAQHRGTVHRLAEAGPPHGHAL